MCRLASTWLVAAGLGLAFMADANALETPEVHATQIKVNRTVSNVAITIPIDIYLAAEIGLEAPKIHLRAVANLGDLQNKVPQLVASAALPKDNCKSYSPKNAVVSISNSRLTYAGGPADFHVEGSAVIWECLQNPVPNTKVEWEIKNVGLGIKTKVPVVKTWPGNPIKSILGTQPFTIDLPITVRAADAKSIAVDVGEAKADLGGQYADITKDILDILKVDINKKLTDVIQAALDPKALAADLPEEMTSAGVVLESARFVEEQGELAVEAHASLTLTGENAKEIGKLLYDEISGNVVKK